MQELQELRTHNTHKNLDINNISYTVKSVHIYLQDSCYFSSESIVSLPLVPDALPSICSGYFSCEHKSVLVTWLEEHMELPVFVFLICSACFARFVNIRFMGLGLI